MTQGGPPSGGGGERTVPEAPTLPDAAPDAVQNLLNGVFDGLDSVAGGIGDVVSGLAQGIGDTVDGATTIVSRGAQVSAESLAEAVPTIVDLAGVFA